jgi:DNA uptake protein ComE-like DNA-binding protein
VFVLWVMVLLALAAYVVGQLMAVHLRARGHALGSQRAAQLARSGLTLARHLLETDEDAGEDFFNDNWATDPVAEGYDLADGRLWLLVGSTAALGGQDVLYGLTDESGKINLNTASRDTLLALPRMTPELADNLIAWRSAQRGVAEEGSAARSGQAGLKGAPFETLDELLRVPGMTAEILYGTDLNRNGIPDDGGEDRAEQFDRGLAGLCTVYSRHHPTEAEREAKDLNGLDREQLEQLLPGISRQVAERIVKFREEHGDFESVAELIMIEGVAKENLRDWWALLRVGEPKTTDGLVNVLTASAEVLAALEPLDEQDARQIHEFVRGGAERPEGLLWLLDLLPKDRFVAVVPLLTTRSERFSTQIVAATADGMYWARHHVVLERYGGTVRVLYFRDDSRHGPHVPTDVREQMAAGR